MTYGELRYDDTGSFAAATSDAEPAPSGELLDDESWYQELRRSAPSYPENPAPRGPVSGPRRRVEPQNPQGPAFGSPSGGYPQAPGRASGFGPSRWDGPDRPQMSAGPNAPRPAGRGGPQASQISAGLTNPVAQGHGFLERSGGSVGLGSIDVGSVGLGRPAHPARRYPGGRPAGRRAPGGSGRPRGPGVLRRRGASHALTAPDATRAGGPPRSGPVTAWTGRGSPVPGRPSRWPTTTSSRTTTSGGTTRTRSTPACSGTGKPSTSGPSRRRRPRPSARSAGDAAAATTTGSGSAWSWYSSCSRPCWPSSSSSSSSRRTAGPRTP